MAKRHKIWVEAYRPKTVSECVLPSRIKDTLTEMVSTEKIPNLLLVGSPGIGKTSVAKALLNEVDCDYLTINGSLDRNIDTLRDEIMGFASTTSFKKKKKFVILDEADYLNPQSTQPALRNFIEEYSSNCGFIFTCNYENKIIPALRSRLSRVEFNPTLDEKKRMMVEFIHRLYHILGTENIEYDKEVVAQLVVSKFPDFRFIINQLESYSVTGKIDSGILSQVNESVTELISLLKSKEFLKVRQWVEDNASMDDSSLFSTLYRVLADEVKTECLAAAVMILSDYQYKCAFSINKNITIMALLTEIMANVEWK